MNFKYTKKLIFWSRHWSFHHKKCLIKKCPCTSRCSNNTVFLCVSCISQFCAPHESRGAPSSSPTRDTIEDLRWKIRLWTLLCTLIKEREKDAFQIKSRFRKQPKKRITSSHEHFTFAHRTVYFYTYGQIPQGSRMRQNCTYLKKKSNLSKKCHKKYPNF